MLYENSTSCLTTAKKRRSCFAAFAGFLIVTCSLPPHGKFYFSCRNGLSAEKAGTAGKIL
jgi:hypothetical protein